MRIIDLEHHHHRPIQPLRSQHRRRVKFPKWARLGLITLLLGVVGYAGYIIFWPAAGSLANIFQAPQAVLSFLQSPEATLKQTDGRTNILLLGTDYRKDMPSENLTDTMMVASVDMRSKNKDVVMVSVPRDLWVSLPQWQIPDGGGTFYSQGGKINSANAYGDAYKYPNGAGLELAREEMQKVLGIQIQYVVRINFYGFKQVVDNLGGVSVTVDNSFTDCEYPIEGQEDNPILSERYKCISFKAGPQYMNGDTALEFARSRHSPNNNEGSDLSRAKRQQKLLVAIRQKALSLQTLSDPLKIKGLIDSLGDNVRTLDVDFGQIGAWYHLTQQLDTDRAENIVLSDDPANSAYLLRVGDPGLYGGAFVFLPLAGQDNYAKIHAYVAQRLSDATAREATASAQSR